MPVNEYYLRSNNESELLSALRVEGLHTIGRGDDFSHHSHFNGVSSVYIGKIRTAEVIGEDVNGYPEYVYSEPEGFHCNIYSNSDLPASLAQFEVSPTPTTPLLKLAGQ